MHLEYISDPLHRTESLTSGSRGRVPVAHRPLDVADARSLVEGQHLNRWNGIGNQRTKDNHAAACVTHDVCRGFGHHESETSYCVGTKVALVAKRRRRATCRANLGLLADVHHN
jgi:hypothetical protein